MAKKRKTIGKTVEVFPNEAGEIIVLIQRDQPDAYFLHFSLAEAERCARMILEEVDEVRFARMCQEDGADWWRRE